MAEPADTVERVVRRLRSDDAQALVPTEADSVLRRAEPVARAMCRRHLPGASAERIEDVVQETLEIVWRRLSTFNGEGKFESWVRGIARNVCAGNRRKRTEILSVDGELDPQDSDLDALRTLQRHEREAVVTAAIQASLDGVEQDVLYHRHLHGLDRERIAELVGLDSADEVRVVLQRAQRRLKSELLRRLLELGHGVSFVHTRDA